MARFFYYLVALALALAIVILSQQAAHFNRVASANFGLEKSTELAVKSILERLSFSLYRGASDSKADTMSLFNEAARLEALVKKMALGFLAASVVFVGFGVIREALGKQENRSLTIDLFAVSLICLVVGLIAPLLSIKAFTTAPLVGEVILKYEIKSILSTIKSLALADQYFVALLVGLFSVVTPAIKLLISALVLQVRRASWHNKALSWIKVAGKWSMADVFVVAVLVAYFAVGADNFTKAQLGVGLYFFSAYCVLSLITTQRLLSELGSEQGESDE